MRCAANCGVFAVARKQGTVRQDALAKGFRQLGKLFYCPRCAAKREATGA
jgi:hypothetical protein